jgi:hypothetical protein
MVSMFLKSMMYHPKKKMMRIRAIQWSYSLVKHPAETQKIGEKSSQAFVREGSDSDMTLLCFVDTVCIFSYVLWIWWKRRRGDRNKSMFYV